jgi:predicted CopG family antitoxin
MALYMLACIYACMTSRNINIELSVYDRLKKFKKADESFSQALDRLMSASCKSIKASFGTIKDLDYAEIKKARRDRDVVL